MNGVSIRKRGQSLKFACALVGAIPPHAYESLSALSQAYHNMNISNVAAMILSVLVISLPCLVSQNYGKRYCFAKLKIVGLPVVAIFVASIWILESADLLSWMKSRGDIDDQPAGEHVFCRIECTQHSVKYYIPFKYDHAVIKIRQFILHRSMQAFARTSIVSTILIFR